MRKFRDENKLVKSYGNINKFYNLTDNGRNIKKKKGTNCEGTDKRKRVVETKSNKLEWNTEIVNMC